MVSIPQLSVRVGALILPAIVAGFQVNYLNTLSAPKKAPIISSGNTNKYLNSLGSEPSPTQHSTLPPVDLNQVAIETPLDHYAKENPGAGWAGYKHPLFGGYLDRLKENAWEEGKEADYGNDIRWGAQVYLDALEP